jgi:hypothetical protein
MTDDYPNLERLREQLLGTSKKSRRSHDDGASMGAKSSPYRRGGRSSHGGVILLVVLILAASMALYVTNRRSTATNRDTTFSSRASSIPYTAPITPPAASHGTAVSTTIFRGAVSLAPTTALSTAPSAISQPTSTFPTTTRPLQRASTSLPAPSSYVVDDSAAGGNTPDDGTLQKRFWRYSTGFEVVGTGTGGESQIVDTSSGCQSHSYAVWLLEGVPEGNYKVEAYIPNWPGLATNAPYDGDVIDQAANQGHWVLIRDYSSQSKGYYGVVDISISLNTATDAGCANGVVIFDAMRFTRQQR